MDKHTEQEIEKSPLSEPTAEAILETARQRVEDRKEAKDQPELSQQQRTWVQKLNRVVFWLSKHWLALFNFFNGLYVGSAFLAPALMASGRVQAAAFLYRFYKYFCHQYPVRSWFILGDRLIAAYPTTSGMIDQEMHYASEFVGNALLGYKVAFCQRDVAIYGAIFLAGLLYVLVRHWWNMPPLPWWAYIAFGIVPMGIDGGYQLISQIIMRFNPSLGLPRESTPFLRTLTGSLFGLTTIGFIYPYIDEFFKETRELLASRYGWQ